MKVGGVLHSVDGSLEHRACARTIHSKRLQTSGLGDSGGGKDAIAVVLLLTGRGGAAPH